MRNPITKISQSDLADPTAKRTYNQQLFQEVAPQYTRITRYMSFGRDQSWKKKLVNILPKLSAPACLDLASGTGDLVLVLYKRFPAASITAVDLSEHMLAICQNRCEHLPNLEIREADMNALQMPEASFDLITGGYALRNSPDLPLTLREIKRMLKPGGTAAFLDFSRSNNRILQYLQFGLLSFWGKLWGLLLHRNPNVYGYIAESLKSYPTRSERQTLFQQVGLVIRQQKLLFFGFLEIIVLEKE